jgi:multidrug efflux pump subunit AcrB
LTATAPCCALLCLMLRRPRSSVGALLAMLALAVFGLGYVPPGFMPDSARPQFVIDAWLPQGTDIMENSRQLQEMEEPVRPRPSVSAVTSFIGSGGPRFMFTYSPEPANSAYGQLLRHFSCWFSPLKPPG